jgi:hypothetical protein
MKIQFECRFLRTKTLKEKEQEAEDKALAELLGKDITISTPDKVYEYDYMVHDSTNIAGWNVVDAKHLAIRTKSGEVYTVKATKEDFAKRWFDITGEEIHVI